VIFSLLITLYLIFRSEAAQKLMVRLAADYFSKELKTEIRIGGFGLSFINGLLIEDSVSGRVLCCSKNVN
jgi:hypothetical protein